MIFVVGNSRSGTTMLGQIFNRNSQVHTFHELHFFEHNIDVETLREGDNAKWSEQKNITLLERLLTSSREGFFATVKTGHYKNEAQKIIESAQSDNPIVLYKTFLYWEAHRAGKTVPCEQTPRYLFFINDILANYPEAKIIHLVRDPRDIIISQRKKWKRRFMGAKNIPLKESLRSWANYHPYIISKLWSGCMKQGQVYLNNSRVKTIRFEDLSKSPQETVRDLCEFIGIPYEDDMLNISLKGSSSSQGDETKRGIDSSRSQSWKSKNSGLSKTELLMCEWVTQNEMKKMGYDVSGDGRFHPRLIFSFVSLFFKLLLIVPMNLSRTKNLADTIRRRLKPAQNPNMEK